VIVIGEQVDENLDIRKLFEDWVEPDVAHYYMAALLGIMVLDESQDGWIRVKGVFNTNNPVGNALYALLECGVAGGLLEKNDDIQYRWNRTFEKNLYWEK